MGKHGEALISFLKSHLTFVWDLIAWHPAKHLYSGSAEAPGSRKYRESTRDLPGGIRPPTKSQVPFLSPFPCRCSFSYLSPMCLTLKSCRCHPFPSLGKISILSTTWTIQCRDGTCWGQVNEAKAPCIPGWAKMKILNTTWYPCC